MKLKMIIKVVLRTFRVLQMLCFAHFIRVLTYGSFFLADFPFLFFPLQLRNLHQYAPNWFIPFDWRNIVSKLFSSQLHEDQPSNRCILLALKLPGLSHLIYSLGVRRAKNARYPCVRSVYLTISFSRSMWRTRCTLPERKTSRQKIASFIDVGFQSLQKEYFDFCLKAGNAHLSIHSDIDTASAVGRSSGRNDSIWRIKSRKAAFSSPSISLLSLRLYFCTPILN